MSDTRHSYRIYNVLVIFYCHIYKQKNIYDNVYVSSQTRNEKENEEKIIFESLSTNKNGSFYTKYGDIFAIIISIIILIVISYKCRKYFY